MRAVGDITKAPPKPEDEFTLRHALKQEVGILAEYTGLYGFIASSAYQAIFPGVNQGKDVYFQGSRQMDNFSRRYYERELGAGIAPSPSMREHFGYTEPFRRFVQREDFSPQANPLRNQMPGWLPGADYLTNFHIGDPFTKVDEGYARLPGAGYGFRESLMVEYIGRGIIFGSAEQRIIFEYDHCPERRTL